MAQFQVGSMYGHETRQPIVVVEIGEEKVQMRPEDARNLALNLLQASEAALSDAFLFSFITEVADGDQAIGARTLQEFRLYRQGRETFVED